MTTVNQPEIPSSNSTSLPKAHTGVYDYVVIGAGLTGLIIAAKLSQQSARVALIDNKETVGGNLKTISYENFTFNQGLKTIPVSNMSEHALQFLATSIGLPLTFKSVNLPPTTLEKDQLIPFVGFGSDVPPEYYDDLMYYLSSDHYQTDPEPHLWPNELFKLFKGDFYNKTYVTQFELASENIVHLVINGAKRILARNYIFCGSIKAIPQLLPVEAIAPRLRQKMAKPKLWSTLSLDLIHSELITDSLATHVFPIHEKKSEHTEIALGCFTSPVVYDNKTLQHSQWLAFLPPEIEQDDEQSANTLKRIKRFIKKVYPEALETIVCEKLTVTNDSHGNIASPLTGHQKLSGIDNLWIASNQIHPQRNMIGSILQAQMVLAAMGFESPVIASEIESTIDTSSSSFEAESYT